MLAIPTLVVFCLALAEDEVLVQPWPWPVGEASIVCASGSWLMTATATPPAFPQSRAARRGVEIRRWSLSSGDSEVVVTIGPAPAPWLPRALWIGEDGTAIVPDPGARALIRIDANGDRRELEVDVEPGPRDRVLALWPDEALVQSHRPEQAPFLHLVPLDGQPPRTLLELPEEVYHPVDARAWRDSVWFVMDLGEHGAWILNRTTGDRRRLEGRPEVHDLVDGWLFVEDGRNAFEDRWLQLHDLARRELLEIPAPLRASHFGPAGALLGDRLWNPATHERWPCPVPLAERRRRVDLPPITPEGRELWFGAAARSSQMPPLHVVLRDPAVVPAPPLPSWDSLLAARGSAGERLAEPGLLHDGAWIRDLPRELDDAAIAVLRHVLDRSDDHNTLVAAAGRLASLHQPWVADEIVAALRDGLPLSVHRSMAQRVAECGQRRHGAALCEVLDARLARDERSLQDVARALASLGHPDALPWLEQHGEHRTERCSNSLRQRPRFDEIFSRRSRR